MKATAIKVLQVALTQTALMARSDLGQTPVARLTAITLETSDPWLALALLRVGLTCLTVRSYSIVIKLDILLHTYSTELTFNI